MDFAKVEMKYEKGRMLNVRTGWILNFNAKYKKTDDFLCYWSDDIDEIAPNLECGYSKEFKGTPSLFKVFISKLGKSIADLESTEGKRLITVSKRFRDSGNTDTELKKLEAKKRRSEKKEVKVNQAKAQEVNTQYLIDNLEKQSTKKTEDDKQNTEDVLTGNDLTEPLHSSLDLMIPSTYEELVKDIVEDADMDCLMVLDTEGGYDEKPDIEVTPTGNDLTNSFGTSLNSMLPTDYEEIVRDIMEDTNFDCLVVPNTDEKDTKNLDTEGGMKKTNPVFQPKCVMNRSNMVTHGGKTKFTATATTVDVSSSILHGGDMRQTEECDSAKTGPTEGHHNSNELLNCYKISEANESNKDGRIIIFNYDEVAKENIDLKIRSNELEVIVNEQKIIIDDLTSKTNQYKSSLDELKAEVTTLKVENAFLKEEVDSGNKRNRMLQNYLVAANQTIPEDLYEEKDGGRLYKGNVFLNKNQCFVLDKSGSDREFLNNLTTAIFGREVLKTHSISGTPSNNTKGPAKNKLNPDLIELIYEIMDARSFANNTKKLTKSEKNSIIGKKCSNVASYRPSAKSMSAASSANEEESKQITDGK